MARRTGTKKGEAPPQDAQLVDGIKEGEKIEKSGGAADQLAQQVDVQVSAVQATTGDLLDIVSTLPPGAIDPDTQQAIDTVVGSTKKVVKKRQGTGAHSEDKKQGRSRGTNKKRENGGPENSVLPDSTIEPPPLPSDSDAAEPEKALAPISPETAPRELDFTIDGQIGTYNGPTIKKDGIWVPGGDGKWENQKRDISFSGTFIEGVPQHGTCEHKLKNSKTGEVGVASYYGNVSPDLRPRSDRYAQLLLPNGDYWLGNFGDNKLLNGTFYRKEAGSAYSVIYVGPVVENELFPGNSFHEPKYDIKNGISISDSDPDKYVRYKDNKPVLYSSLRDARNETNPLTQSEDFVDLSQTNQPEPPSAPEIRRPTREVFVAGDFFRLLDKGKLGAILPDMLGPESNNTGYKAVLDLFDDLTDEKLQELPLSHDLLKETSSGSMSAGLFVEYWKNSRWAEDFYNSLQYVVLSKLEQEMAADESLRQVEYDEGPKEKGLKGFFKHIWKNKTSIVRRSGLGGTFGAAAMLLAKTVVASTGVGTAMLVGFAAVQGARMGRRLNAKAEQKAKEENLERKKEIDKKRFETAQSKLDDFYTEIKKDSAETAAAHLAAALNAKLQDKKVVLGDRGDFEIHVEALIDVHRQAEKRARITNEYQDKIVADGKMCEYLVAAMDFRTRESQKNIVLQDGTLQAARRFVPFKELLSEMRQEIMKGNVSGLWLNDPDAEKKVLGALADGMGGACLGAVAGASAALGIAETAFRFTAGTLFGAVKHQAVERSRSAERKKETFNKGEIKSKLGSLRNKNIPKQLEDPALQEEYQFLKDVLQAAKNGYIDIFARDPKLQLEVEQIVLEIDQEKRLANLTEELQQRSVQTKKEFGEKLRNRFVGDGPRIFSSFQQGVKRGALVAGFGAVYSGLKHVIDTLFPGSILNLEESEEGDAGNEVQEQTSDVSRIQPQPESSLTNSDKHETISVPPEREVMINLEQVHRQIFNQNEFSSSSLSTEESQKAAAVIAQEFEKLKKMDEAGQSGNKEYAVLAKKTLIHLRDFAQKHGHKPMVTLFKPEVLRQAAGIRKK